MTEEQKEELRRRALADMLTKAKASTPTKKVERTVEASPATAMSASAADSEMPESVRDAKARADGGVEKNVLEGVQPGTLTALGTMVAPGYGTAVGAVADVALAAYNENRKTKRENRKFKEELEVASLKNASKAVADRRKLEQRALAQLMRVGQY